MNSKRFNAASSEKRDTCEQMLVVTQAQSALRDKQ
jgi:hypothetical protein